MTRIAIALVAIWARVAHAAPALAPRPEIDAPLPAPLTYVWPLDHAPGHAPHLALDFGAVRCARLQDDGLRITRYTRAWCHEDLQDRLEALRGIVDDDGRGTIGGAAHADLVDELADHAGEPLVMQWLAATHARVGLYDEVVATLVEEGRGAEARALAKVRPPAPASLGVACARAVQIDAEPTPSAVVRELQAAGHAARDLSSCDDIRAARRCAWSLAVLDRGLLTADCDAYAAANPAQRQALELAIAVRAWPTAGAEWDVWADVARHAVRALPRPGAEELAIAALTNAHRVGACDATAHAAVRELAAELLGAFERAEASDARLRALQAACE